MKITLFLLLFVTFQAYCENGYSQSAKISIPRSTLKVSELLTQIESQTDYLFVYNKKSVDTKRVVNVDATNQPVSEILDKAFEGTGIHYVVEGNNIVLTKNVTERASTQQQKQITVKGVVTDMRGEPIIGASVVEKGTTNGTITDLDGNFTLKVPSDAIINITYVGYQPQSLSVSGQTTFNKYAESLPHRRPHLHVWTADPALRIQPGTGQGICCLLVFPDPDTDQCPAYRPESLFQNRQVCRCRKPCSHHRLRQFCCSLSY